MIFLSHNNKDKPVIEQFAIKLREVFGQENIFYDSWAIQPGDGIIDKMNTGIESCKYFLFFVSKNSLASNMVKLEWQNALVKAAGGSIKFIPIRIDGSDMPALLLQTLYIDLFGAGLDVAIRQTLDVVSGKNTYTAENTTFSNLHAKIRVNGLVWEVTVEATQFMSPISSFMLFFTNDLSNFVFGMPGESAYKSSEPFPMTLADGREGFGKLLGLDRATVPGHPVVMCVTCPEGVAIPLLVVMHEVSKGQFKSIPMTMITG
ncbi:toll/interleukin-1 receptor domain-containing protein [Rugamonas sp. CCM 8940]|uniref:toll/interleukin-1 receptor domain-containing protein n=1 Tax=Rugamonas sp. CCM 8940 TaxID=2765359 RepID=UPI0018F670B8|nr:toll/interleukin-1 receptor domain-containing protein [Rugamonas sp. CCM 8940]MBJ7308715.1 toll/interleukin-1 receptor domain-containing protein [Rugamonas sp. CCM 8940]